MEGPERIYGERAVMIEVPAEERQNICHDIADAYCVDVSDQMPGGCMIWGRYHGEWHPNVSARWLLSKLLGGAGKMLQNETCGGDGWWDGWKQIRDVVAVQSAEGK
jgi:hypothetical protein